MNERYLEDGQIARATYHVDAQKFEIFTCIFDYFLLEMNSDYPQLYWTPQLFVLVDKIRGAHDPSQGYPLL
jgi:hypothetical protein